MEISKSILFVFILSVFGWIFTIFIAYGDYQQNRLILKDIAMENPYNIAAKAIGGSSSDKAIFEEFTERFKIKDTAQVGSLKTVCDNDPNKFKLIMTDNAVRKVCNLF